MVGGSLGLRGTKYRSVNRCKVKQPIGKEGREVVLADSVSGCRSILVSEHGREKRLHLDFYGSVAVVNLYVTLCVFG